MSTKGYWGLKKTHWHSKGLTKVHCGLDWAEKGSSWLTKNCRAHWFSSWLYTYLRAKMSPHNFFGYQKGLKTRLKSVHWRSTKNFGADYHEYDSQKRYEYFMF